MSKYIKYLFYVLMGVSAIISVIFYLNPESESMVQTLLTWTYILLGVAAFVALIMPLFFSSAKSLKKLFINLGIVAIIVGISYLCAPGSPASVHMATEPTAVTLKLTDTGLIITGLLLVAAIGSIVFGSVINAVRNR